MTRRTITVGQLATEAGLDVDEALLRLWDDGFSRATSPEYVFPKRESNRVRRSLGLATRRELQSKQYWTQTLGLKSDEELDALLRDCGISKPTDGRRLRATAIRRLMAERRQRALVRPRERDASPVTRETSREPFRWRTVGNESDVILLTPEQVCAIHDQLVADFQNTPDPLDPPGVRSVQLLESAVSRPATAIGEHRKYPSIEMATAALVHSLVHDRSSISQRQQAYSFSGDARGPRREWSNAYLLGGRAV